MPAKRMRVLLVGSKEHDSEWTEHIRTLEGFGIDLDLIQGRDSPEELAARALHGNTVVIVDISEDPAWGMQTVSTCRRIAEQVPVVVVTDDSSIELSRRIRRSGVFYLAVPPVTPEEMLHIVTATVPLEAEGYSVCSATNGKDGLKKVQAEQPDLIILDVMMEHLSAGYEVNQAVKYKDEYKSVSNIPILMISSITLDPATRFSRAGEMDMIMPDDYLTKPLAIPEFLDKVRGLLGGKK